MCTVAVIGGGPAGCVVSILLARAGINVVLIEQHRFPRDKVCGECLSTLGIGVLDRLHLSARLRSHHLSLLRRTVLYPTRGNSATLDLPQPMWGVSRLVFDQFLFKAAQYNGVKVIQPARCEAIDSNTTPRLKIRELESNAVHDIEAGYVVIAGGKSHVRPSRDFGIKAHFTKVDAPADAIGLFGVVGHYGGIAPIEGGKWNIAFSVPQARIEQHRRDIDGLMKQVFAQNHALTRQLRRAERITEWQVAPLPRFGVTNGWMPRVIPVGNAAAAIEPISGEGIGLAMRSAELAAEALIDAIKRGVELDTSHLRHDYRQLWRRRGIASRLAALAVSSPLICRAMLPFISGEDGFSGLVLRAMGKA